LIVLAFVITSYIIIFTSTDPASSTAFSFIPTNSFVFVCCVGLGPYCFFSEKSRLEKFLLATRYDGGEAAENLVKRGEEMKIDERLQTDNRHNVVEDNDSSNNNDDALSIKSLEASQARVPQPQPMFKDDEGERILEEDFGSIMKNLTKNDIELVASLTSNQREKDEGQLSVASDEACKYIDPMKLQSFCHELLFDNRSVSSTISSKSDM